MVFGLIVPLQAGVRASVPSLVMQSGLFNKFLLALLLVLSIATWAILVERWRRISAVRAADRRFRAAFRSAGALGTVRLLASQHPQSLQARLAEEGLAHLWPRGEQPDLSVESVELASRAMERLRSDELDVLEKNVNFLATVAGLAAAIPAVVGFNILAGRMRVLANDAATFVSEFIDVAARESRGRHRGAIPGAPAVYEGAGR